MCGICGELRFDRQAPDPFVLARMAERLKRRGPDHGGFFSEGPLALGHRRLSIIDLSENSDQPMRDGELGLTLVFNGAIYNYQALRRELEEKGYRFFSGGDSEVIIKAYHAWGKACLNRLEGIFAFALWQERTKTLFLARDPFGVKPLYWTRDKHRFRFASTLPALFANGDIPLEIDEAGLQFQFTLHGSVPAPYTVFRDIRKLPPANWMEIDEAGKTRQETYWHLKASRPPGQDEEEAIREACEKLTAAVKSQHRVADVTVGVLLSGGLDSSLLLALLPEQPIPAFSIGFGDQPEESGNEFKYSELVARHFGARHHRYHITDKKLLEALPEAISAMSEPMFSQDNVAFYLLAQEVKKEVKTVLSGQGADEVFAGYYWYPRMAADRAQNPPLLSFARHYFDRPHAEYLEMLSAARREQSQRDAVSGFIENRLQEEGADTFLDQVLRLDATTLIVDDPVKRIDNMTMAFGLEARVPFLDKAVVEAAMRISPETRLKEGGKYPLKRMARGLLPDEIIDRPKGYFPTPALKYLRGGFFEFIRETLESHACKERNLYDRAYVDKLLSEPLQHFTPLAGNKLWHLAAFEYWLQVQERN